MRNDTNMITFNAAMVALGAFNVTREQPSRLAWAALWCNALCLAFYLGRWAKGGDRG